MTQPICKDCAAPTACKMTGSCALGRIYTISTANLGQHEVWAPTMELRYLRRQEKPGWFSTVLQQRWVRQSGSGPVSASLEWRDIPTVDEG